MSPMPKAAALLPTQGLGPVALASFLVALALAWAAPAASPAAGPLPESDPAATVKLQALLRHNTTNPPGDEALAARRIAGWLKAEGLQPELIPTAPNREAVVCRIKGRDSANPLLLLGHLDVVEADGVRWEVMPFAGTLRADRIYGRGALDMKGLVVMELEAFLDLHRRGQMPSRDVIFAATPDEEAGGDQGVAWLMAHRPDSIKATEALNEGGAGLVMPNGRALMGIQAAERGALWVRVSAHAAPGHGAQDRPDGAPRRLLRALARLEATPRHFELGAETQAMLQAMAETQEGARAWALRLLAQPWAVGWIAPRAVAAEPQLGPLLSMTVNPTVLRSGNKVNVVPGEASAELDLRILPGHSTAEALAWLQQCLDDPTLKVEVTHRLEPSRSPTDGPLYAALAQACREGYPSTPVSPILTPGGSTDSSHLRPRGVRCYGLMPILATSEQLASMHGDNEYMTVSQLAQGTAVLKRALALATQTQSP